MNDELNFGGVLVSTGEAVAEEASRGCTSPQNGAQKLNANENNYALAA